MSVLSPFLFDATVTPEDGREDKISLELGIWIIGATPDGLDDIREFLCVAPVNVRDDEETLPLYGWLFTRPNGIQGRFKPLHVRNSRITWGPQSDITEKPLFGGKCHWGTVPDHSYSARLRLSLKRSVNTAGIKRLIT